MVMCLESLISLALFVTAGNPHPKTLADFHQKCYQLSHILLQLRKTPTGDKTLTGSNFRSQNVPLRVSTKVQAVFKKATNTFFFFWRGGEMCNVQLGGDRRIE